MQIIFSRLHRAQSILTAWPGDIDHYSIYESTPNLIISDLKYNGELSANSFVFRFGAYKGYWETEFVSWSLKKYFINAGLWVN